MEQEPPRHCHGFIQMCGTNVKGEQRLCVLRGLVKDNILLDPSRVGLRELVTQ